MAGLADIPLRTVAFLDILGFKAKLFNTPLLELASLLRKKNTRTDAAKQGADYRASDETLRSFHGEMRTNGQE